MDARFLFAEEALEVVTTQGGRRKHRAHFSAARLRLRLDAATPLRHLAPRMKVVLLANAPEALTELCGVSLLERHLRILQRLGFSEVTIVSDTPNLIQVA